MKFAKKRGKRMYQYFRMKDVGGSSSAPGPLAPPADPFVLRCFKKLRPGGGFVCGSTFFNTIPGVSKVASTLEVRVGRLSGISSSSQLSGANGLTSAVYAMLVIRSAVRGKVTWNSSLKLARRKLQAGMVANT